MNNGIISSAPQPYTRIYEFTLTSKPADAQGVNGSYIWTPPTDCSFLEIVLIGGGGGGSAGTRQATGVARRGGGAGGCGAITWVIFDRRFFNAPLTITIGTGGAGGASATTDNTGNNITGANGIASSIFMSGVQILAAAGGTAGASGGSGGIGGNQGTITGGQTGSSSLVAYSSSAVTQQGVAPGGGGGGATSLNAYFIGQPVSPHGGPLFYDRRYQGVPGALTTYPGGGDCAAGVAGGDGADGLFYGSPGSGGGASDNGYASGKGGNGAGGYLRVVCF